METEGFDKFKIKVQNLQGKIEDYATAKVVDAGKEWAALAKRAAPIDQRTLRSEISSFTSGVMEASVVSPAAHSRFVEWGTKGKKIVPSDLVAYESSLSYQRSGDYYDFLNAILDWVKRKGISNVKNSYTGKNVGGKAAKENLLAVAEAIAFSIMRHGIKPHPFFFIQRPVVEGKLMSDIKKYVATQQ